jgi:hypothetical protein
VLRWLIAAGGAGWVTSSGSSSVSAGFRFPREVAVRWYLRCGLSYRDVGELAERGRIMFSSGTRPRRRKLLKPFLILSDRRFSLQEPQCHTSRVANVLTSLAENFVGVTGAARVRGSKTSLCLGGTSSDPVG